jgi:hypothetical protein
MPTLASTQTFADGSVLSASALTNHVVDATPLATFISGQTATTAPLPADELLIATSGSSTARKVTLSTLSAHLPTGTTAVDLAVTGAATVTGALTANSNTVLGDAAEDTLTVNATSSFGNPVTIGSNTTLGSDAVTSATWTRSTTTLTITKTAHGLTTGNSRYFVFTGTTPTPSSVLNGTYFVTVTSVDVFNITVANVGDTVGTVTWYEKTLTLSSTITGPLQGNIPINVASVDLGSGDEFLVKDASDSNRMKTTIGGLIKAYGNIELHSATVTTIPGFVTRVSGSNTATITKTDHNLRVGDVIYTTGGISSDWYAVASVTSSSVFTVQTASTSGVTAAAINWYSYNFVGNNIHSVYGNKATSSTSATAVQVNFINKPSAVTYCLTLTVETGSSNSSKIIPVNGTASGDSTGLDGTLLKTVNGFGVGILNYDGIAQPSEPDSFLNFMSIW